MIGSDREEDFLLEYQNTLTEFIESTEKTLILPPMNSFFRRLVHNLAKRFKLNTASKGGELDRHVTISKTDVSFIPKPITKKAQPIWNFGDKEFLVDPQAEQVEVGLEKDGTVSLADPSKSGIYLDVKKVTTGAFKIRNNKVVEIQDSEW
ncbi:MAG: hypothetical protein GY786_09980 [Proteobacteria bacterium]|nr:hypothetical protein [Pseudomonadota bacterium]